MVAGTLTGDHLVLERRLDRHLQEPPVGARCQQKRGEPLCAAEPGWADEHRLLPAGPSTKLWARLIVTYEQALP